MIRPPAYSKLQFDTDWAATVAEWLAGVFRFPLTASDIRGYRNGLGASLLEELQEQPGLCAGALRMQSALTGTKSADLLSRELGMAFVLLFEGAGGPRTVSPFESAHAGTGARLFQAEAAAMDSRLDRAGLSTASGNEPADHLSIELALLARLLRSLSGRDETAALLDQHLLAWVPGFARQVETGDGTGFYGGAASLLSGFLADLDVAIAADGYRSPLPRMAIIPTSGETAC